MEEELNISPEYKQWFNRGYELRKTAPDMFQGMTTPTNNPSEKTQAFNAGAKQYEKELALNQQRNTLDRSKYTGRER